MLLERSWTTFFEIDKSLYPAEMPYISYYLFWMNKIKRFIVQSFRLL